MSTAPLRFRALHVRDIAESNLNSYLDTISSMARRGTEEQPYIPMIISSNGGSVSVATAMIDTLAATGREVWTLNAGWAYSAGASLLAAGTKGRRYVMPNSQTMVHGSNTFVPSGMGNVHVALDTLRSMAMNEQMVDAHFLGMLDRFTGQRGGHWMDVVRRAEGRSLFYIGEEAVAVGLADHACVPPEFFNWIL